MTTDSLLPSVEGERERGREGDGERSVERWGWAADEPRLSS